MHRFESMLEPGRQILAFDPTGPAGPPRSSATSTGPAGLGGRPRRRHRSADLREVRPPVLRTRRHGARAPGAAAARRAGRPARRRSPGPTTPRRPASAWTPPPAGSPRTARCGSPTSCRGCSGSRVALFCHSYGSVVCGVAADDLPARVTDIAVSGSPGMRADNAARPRHRAPGSGRCGTATTGSRTCRTWRSAASATAPTRSHRPSGRACCPRPARSATPATSCRAPDSLDNFAEIGDRLVRQRRLRLQRSGLPRRLAPQR